MKSNRRVEMNKYKLMPVEPIHEMLNAPLQGGRFENRLDLRPSIYRTMLAEAPAINIVATKNEQGQIVSVTLQDEDHRILEVIAEADVQGEPLPCQECGGDGAGGEHEEDCAMVQPAEHQPAPDVAGLVEALEQCITSMLDSGYRANALVIRAARSALAAHRKQGGEV